VTYRHSQYRTFPTEALDNSTAQEVSAAKDGYLGHYSCR
jgi:hypothetical protein